MKNYKITVNGNVYDVAVEELGVAASAPVNPVAAAPVVAPAPVQAAPVATGSTGSKGSVTIASPMPGKIISIKTPVGTVVKKGQPMIILEAMKMENEIVALEDGTVASIDVNEGAMVEAGTVLATLN